MEWWSHRKPGGKWNAGLKFADQTREGEGAKKKEVGTVRLVMTSTGESREEAFDNLFLSLNHAVEMIRDVAEKIEEEGI